MRKEIEDRLSIIIGLPLAKAGRASSLAWFHFGKLSVVKGWNNKEKIVGEYALHIECAWRITRGTDILITSRDIYQPNSKWTGTEESFEWDTIGMSLFDEKIDDVINNGQPPIFTQSIQVDDFGGIKLSFTNGLCLELFSDKSSSDEIWRFFIPGDIDSHLVVLGGSLKFNN